jgi:hypothetical protein
LYYFPQQDHFVSQLEITQQPASADMGEWGTFFQWWIQNAL